MNRDEAIKKYLHPPSIELILSVVKDAGVKPTHFERYFGIAHGTIKNIKAGFKFMPYKHWSLFYEWECNKKVSKKRTKTVLKKVSKKPQAEIVSNRLKGLL